LETLAGHVTLGVLVLQDIGTILFLAVQPNLKHPAVGLLALAFGKVILLVVVAYLMSKFVLPPLFKMWRDCRSWCWWGRWRGVLRWRALRVRWGCHARWAR